MDVRRTRLGEGAAFAVLLLTAAALLFTGLDGPTEAQPGYIHDECYQAFTAHRYALGDPGAWGWAQKEEIEKFLKEDMTPNTTYEWVHPPTAKLIMSASIALFGFTPFAYRLPSVLAGLFTLLMTWLIAKKVFGAEAGLVAVGLLAIDGLFFVMSRIAMNDIYVTAAIAGLGYGVVRYFLDKDDRLRWLLWTGVFSGIALSTKWNAAPSVLLAGLLLVGEMIWRRQEVSPVKPLLILFICFGLLPPLIYLASYGPYFSLGHGFSELVKLTQDIWGYHHHLKEGHSSSSHWFQWPFVIRPVWFYQAPGINEGDLREIFAFPNPLVWFPMFVSVGVLAYRSVEQRDLGEFLLLAFFGAVWLPWAVIGRVTFIQYVLPAMPFGAAALGGWILRLASAGHRRWAYAYLVLCFLAFANLYPILTSKSIHPSELKSPRWFWTNAWRTCSGDCAMAPAAPKETVACGSAASEDQPQGQD